MANLWETLAPEQQSALVKAHVAGNGGATPQNISRAKEQLSQNPTLVDRLAKETGITEGEEILQDDEDIQGINDIEAAVDDALIDEGDVQETGELSRTVDMADASSAPKRPVDWQKLIDNAESDQDLLRIIRKMKQQGISPPADLEPQPAPKEDRKLASETVKNSTASKPKRRERLPEPGDMELDAPSRNVDKFGYDDEAESAMASEKLRGIIDEELNPKRPMLSAEEIARAVPDTNPISKRKSGYRDNPHTPKPNEMGSYRMPLELLTEEEMLRQFLLGGKKI